jgi:hypothetical protein
VKDPKHVENGSKTGPSPLKSKVQKDDDSLSPFSDEDDVKPSK